MLPVITPVPVAASKAVAPISTPPRVVGPAPVVQDARVAHPVSSTPPNPVAHPVPSNPPNPVVNAAPVVTKAPVAVPAPAIAPTRVSRRIRKLDPLPSFVTSTDEPSVDEALSGPDRDKWLQAMETELGSIRERGMITQVTREQTTQRPMGSEDQERFQQQDPAVQGTISCSRILPARRN